MNQEKYFISAVPNAKNDAVELTAPNVLRVRINAKPINGEANRRLIEILADYFDVPKSYIEIKAGNTFKQKIVLVTKN